MKNKLLLFATMFFLMIGSVSAIVNISCSGSLSTSGDINITGINLCSYIQSSGDIYLTNAFIQQNLTGSNKNINITIISTGGKIVIINSTLLAMPFGGGAGTPAIYVNGTLDLQGNTGIEVYSNSKLVGTASLSSATTPYPFGLMSETVNNNWGFGLCRFTSSSGDIKINDSSVFCNGGRNDNDDAGCHVFPVGASRSYLIAQNVYFNNVSWMSDSGSCNGNAHGQVFTINESETISIIKSNISLRYGWSHDGAGALTNLGDAASPFIFDLKAKDISIIDTRINTKGVAYSTIKTPYWHIFVNDSLTLKGLNVTIAVDDTNYPNRIFINFTDMIAPTWQDKPHWILNNSASIYEKHNVYFYVKGLVFNMSQFKPHNISIYGNYLNISNLRNVYYNYPYNVSFDLFNDSIVEINPRPPQFSSLWNNVTTRTISFDNESYMNNWLRTCTPNSAGNCTIKIRVDSYNPSILNFTNVSVKYYNGGVSNRTLVAFNLTNSTRYLWLWVNQTNASMGIRFNLNMTVEQNASI